ncbi:MAG TPA: MFS transporter [Reyranellaceae bacterium]|nr:MFS transporter [Reyranellaceae bacterium]
MKLQYGWIVVAAGALMGCIAIGTAFSLVVFLPAISGETGWSRTGLSTAMTIVFIVMGVAAFGWGALTDRYGPKPVVLAGSLLLGLGLTLSSRASSLLEFQVVYGVLVGASAGAVFVPMMATVTGWFDKHRAIAVSLVSAGMGVAPMVVSPFAGWLVEHYDWRTSLFTIAILAWVILVPTALLVRRPPPETSAPMDAAAAAAAGVADPGMTAGQALRSPQFIVLAATYFFCCGAHSGPIIHTVSYAVACGLTPLAAVSVYSLEGAAGLGGRLLFGFAGDRYGVKPALMAGLMLQALGILAYYFTRSLGEFYAVAALVGLPYGGVMPLYAVLAREYFPLRIMGTVIGASAMVASMGMALGPVLGGWLFDNFGSYGPLYIASFGLGLGAVGIAFFFPPIPSQRRQVAQPA